MNIQVFYCIIGVMMVFTSSAKIIRSCLWKADECSEIISDYTASDYVQDGLVFQFDGIENYGYGVHSDSHIMDLVINKNLKPKQCVTIEPNCISCISPTSAWFEFDLKGFDADQTIEILFQTEDISSKIQLVLVNLYYRRLIGVVGTSIGIGLRQGVTPSWYVPRKPIAVTSVYEGTSQTANAAYVNGVAYPTKQSSIASPLGNNVVFVGYGYCSQNVDSNTGFSGKIFSIRIYNRMLTPVEVMWNSKIDKERFGL